MEKKYVQKILKKLNCSRKRKNEIGRQLLGDIDLEKSKGKKVADILENMGTPAEIAEEFNNSFSPEEKKKHRKEKRGEWLSIIGVLVLLIVIGVFWAFPRTTALEHSSVYDAEAVQARAEEVIQLIAAGEYDTILEFSVPQLESVLNEDKMTEIKNTFSADWGEFVSYGNVYLGEVKQMGNSSAVVQMNAAYENVSISYTLSFNKEMQLQGLWMK